MKKHLRLIGVFAASAALAVCATAGTAWAAPSDAPASKDAKIHIAPQSYDEMSKLPFGETVTNKTNSDDNLYYTFTAPERGLYTLTATSKFEPELRVYSSSDFDPRTKLATHWEDDFTRTSTFMMDKGQTVYIFLSQWDSENKQNVSIRADKAPNDLGTLATDEDGEEYDYYRVEVDKNSTLSEGDTVEAKDINVLVTDYYGMSLVPGTDYDVQLYAYQWDEETGEESLVLIPDNKVPSDGFMIKAIGKGAFTGEKSINEYPLDPTNLFCYDPDKFIFFGKTSDVDAAIANMSFSLTSKKGTTTVKASDLPTPQIFTYDDFEEYWGWDGSTDLYGTTLSSGLYAVAFTAPEDSQFNYESRCVGYLELNDNGFDFNDCHVNWDDDGFFFNGEFIAPKVSVEYRSPYTDYAGTYLDEGVDYEVVGYQRYSWSGDKWVDVSGTPTEEGEYRVLIKSIQDPSKIIYSEDMYFDASYSPNRIDLQKVIWDAWDNDAVILEGNGDNGDIAVSALETFDPSLTFTYKNKTYKLDSSSCKITFDIGGYDEERDDYVSEYVTLDEVKASSDVRQKLVDATERSGWINMYFEPTSEDLADFYGKYSVSLSVFADDDINLYTFDGDVDPSTGHLRKGDQWLYNYPGVYTGKSQAPSFYIIDPSTGTKYTQSSCKVVWTDNQAGKVVTAPINASTYTMHISIPGKTGTIYRYAFISPAYQSKSLTASLSSKKSVSSKTVKFSKKKASTFKLYAYKKAGTGKVTFKKKSCTAKSKKYKKYCSYITVSSTGKVTVKKKCAKGTYYLTVTMKVGATQNYMDKTITKKITIKVK